MGDEIETWPSIKHSKLQAVSFLHVLLEERTNKQWQVLQAVRCVSPPESHVEGEVTENTRRKSQSHILIETSRIMGSDYGSGAEKGRQHFMIPNIVLS